MQPRRAALRGAGPAWLLHSGSTRGTEARSALARLGSSGKNRYFLDILLPAILLEWRGNLAIVVADWERQLVFPVWGGVRSGGQQLAAAPAAGPHHHRSSATYSRHC